MAATTDAMLDHEKDTTFFWENIRFSVAEQHALVL